MTDASDRFRELTQLSSASDDPALSLVQRSPGHRTLDEGQQPKNLHEIRPSDGRRTLVEWVGDAYPIHKPEVVKTQDYRQVPGCLAAVLYGQTRAFLDAVIAGLDGLGKIGPLEHAGKEEPTPCWPASGDVSRHLTLTASIAEQPADVSLSVRLDPVAVASNNDGYCCCTAPFSIGVSDGHDAERRNSVGHVNLDYRHPILGSVNRSLKFDGLATPQDVANSIRKALLADAAPTGGDLPPNQQKVTPVQGA